MKPTDASAAEMMRKGAALLAFLRENAVLRRKRIPSYSSEERVLWFADIPKERDECRSPFLASSG